MIRENKYAQYGFPREEADILGITIHELDNGMTAQQFHDWLDDGCKTTTEGCHYICDDVQTVQAIPDNWAVYHTGKDRDYGCQNTIAIKICNSISTDKYLAAENNAIELIKKLIKQYSIPYEKIFFHMDFNERSYCPKTILDNYGSARNFVYQRIEGD